MLSAVFASEAEPLDPDRAWSVLRPYWDQVVERFKRVGHPEPGAVGKVRVDPKWHDTCRHFAGASHDCQVLVVAPELADLPHENILAILAHEGGHFVDLANPGRFWFREANRFRLREGARVQSVKDVPDTDDSRREPMLFECSVLPEKGLAKHLREWRDRESDEVERTADAIAEVVIGRRIGYTGEPGCLIQTMARGIARPINLR